MDKIDIKKVEHVTIDVFIQLKGTSDEIVKRFKKMLDTRAIDVDDIKLITVDYNTSSGDVANAPVRIYLASGIAIYLNLTAGYSGSGPTDLCTILKMCEIDFNENDIKSDQQEVNLRYIKSDNKLYHFIKHDGTHEYSM